MSTELDLSLIILDPEIQPREKMDHDTIAQYAEDMLAGIKLPPPVVYHDGDQYWVSQGFHRCMAAEQAGLESIIVEIRQGSRQEALWDAAGSNREHDQSGLRRTNADKRRAIRMALEAMPKKSDRAIADWVGVNQSTVSSHRHSLTDGKHQSSSRTDVNGIDRKMPFLPEKLPEKSKGWSPPMFPPETVDSLGRAKDLNKEEVEFALNLNESRSKGDVKGIFGGMLSVVPAEIAEAKQAASKPTFNQTNEMVDWARWTWNPVTGCEHNCVYCYARDIANRFYPEKFTPTFRPERLDAPRNTWTGTVEQRVLGEDNPIDRTAWKNVFVCSMADLFGRWVPDEWIDKVFDSCRQSPQWNYLFLTKFPQRYTDLDFPETAWVGTSIDEQKRIPNAEKAFRKIEVPVKWLSVEPMREPLEFNDLSMFDWVVIGGQSRSSGAPEFFPDPFWVLKLIGQAHDAGCKVYCKPNTDLRGGWASIFKEYPGIFLES